jgi:hypothetical protein
MRTYFVCILCFVRQALDAAVFDTGLSTGSSKKFQRQRMVSRLIFS